MTYALDTGLTAILTALRTPHRYHGFDVGTLDVDLHDQAAEEALLRLLTDVTTEEWITKEGGRYRTHLGRLPCGLRLDVTVTEADR